MLNQIKAALLIFQRLSNLFINIGVTFAYVYIEVLSNSHVHFDLLVVGVVDQFEVLEFEFANVFDFRIQLKKREWMWHALELSLQGLDVVGIDVSVTECVHKLTTLEITKYSKEAGQKRV